jgi:hypothetical protein
MPEVAGKMITPDWLTLHGGELRPSANGESWSVYFGGSLEYLLTLIPARGKFSCRVMQANNGKRLDKGGVFPTPEAAVRGGLDDLRVALGW